MNATVQAGLAALALSGIAFGIGRLIVYFGERSIEQKYGTYGVRDRLVGCAKLEAALEARKVERIQKLKEANAAVEDATKRRRQVERRLADAVGSGDILVRVIGEEAQGTPCFHAEVSNRYVGGANFEQKQHAYIDPSWAAPQVLEIWARSVAEARTEIERRYPPAFGYVIGRLLDINSVEANKPKPKA